MSGCVKLTAEQLGLSLVEGPFTSVGGYPKFWAIKRQQDVDILCHTCAASAAIT